MENTILTRGDAGQGQFLVRRGWIQLRHFTWFCTKFWVLSSSHNAVISKWNAKTVLLRRKHDVKVCVYRSEFLNKERNTIMRYGFRFQRRFSDFHRKNARIWNICPHIIEEKSFFRWLYYLENFIWEGDKRGFTHINDISSIMRLYMKNHFIVCQS